MFTIADMENYVSKYTKGDVQLDYNRHLWEYDLDPVAIALLINEIEDRLQIAIPTSRIIEDLELSICSLTAIISEHMSIPVANLERS